MKNIGKTELINTLVIEMRTITLIKENELGYRAAFAAVNKVWPLIDYLQKNQHNGQQIRE